MVAIRRFSILGVAALGALGIVFWFSSERPPTPIECASVPGSPHVRAYRAEIQRVTPGGNAILKSGDELRLAGVRMRSVDETQEPELLDMVNRIVLRTSDGVCVKHDTVSNTAVIYYRQGIHYLPDYIIPITDFLKRQKRTALGTVNELLLVMAAAKYDPSVGWMTKKATRRCEVAAEKAEFAFWRRYRDRTLDEYEFSSAQLYLYQDGYRARITKGDVPERDANLAECQEKTRRLGRLDVPISHDYVPVPKLDDVPQLVEAMEDKNRCVRRFAAGALRKLGPKGAGTAAVPALIKALSDEDRYVRTDAARALGNIGSKEAKRALELYRIDRVKKD